MSFAEHEVLDGEKALRIVARIFELEEKPEKCTNCSGPVIYGLIPRVRCNRCGFTTFNPPPNIMPWWSGRDLAVPAPVLKSQLIRGLLAISRIAPEKRPCPDCSFSPLEIQAVLAKQCTKCPAKAYEEFRP